MKKTVITFLSLFFLINKISAADDNPEDWGIYQDFYKASDSGSRIKIANERSNGKCAYSICSIILDNDLETFSFTVEFIPPSMAYDSWLGFEKSKAKNMTEKFVKMLQSVKDAMGYSVDFGNDNDFWTCDDTSHYVKFLSVLHSNRIISKNVRELLLGKIEESPELNRINKVKTLKNLSIDYIRAHLNRFTYFDSQTNRQYQGKDAISKNVPSDLQSDVFPEGSFQKDMDIESKRWKKKGNLDNALNGEKEFCGENFSITSKDDNGIIRSIAIGLPWPNPDNKSDRICVEFFNDYDLPSQKEKFNTLLQGLSYTLGSD